MKTKECLKKSMRLVEISIRKATSYKVVKSRLNYRLYDDKLLQDKLSIEDKSFDEIVNG